MNIQDRIRRIREQASRVAALPDEECVTTARNQVVCDYLTATSAMTMLEVLDHFDALGGCHPSAGGFQKDLTRLINHYSKENESDTPDYILAGYIEGCLKAFSEATKARSQWYGRKD